MKNKIMIILTLTIITMFFIAGCTKTKTQPTTPTTPTQPTPEDTGDETVNGLSTDISSIEIIDDDLDTQDLDNLSQDLNDLDW
jgi:uncharacterized lipoprotein YajG